MEFINILLQFSIYFIESYVLWRLMNSVLEVKYHKNITLFIAGGMFVLMSLKHVFVSRIELDYFQSFSTFLLIIYVLLCFNFCFLDRFLVKLTWWGIFYVVIIIMEIATIFLLRIMMNKTLGDTMNDQISLYIVLLGKLLLVAVFEYIIRKRKSNLMIDFTYYRELTLILLFNLVLLLAVVYIFTNLKNIMNRIDGIILFIFGVVFLISVYIIVLIFRLEKKSREELEMQLKLQQTQLELKMNDDMIQVSDKLRKLRHDMNNHIGLIKTLVHTGRYADLAEYIDQIYEDVEIANELVITDKKTLSVLLNAKIRLAKAKNIDFTSFIMSQDIPMRSKDLCTLLGNILDNAIEAAEKSGNKKYIELMMQNTEEGYVISCENSLSVKPVLKKGKFFTLKEDKSKHGIGVENIKDIVSKYQGEINFDYDDEMFRVRLVLPII